LKRQNKEKPPSEVRGNKIVHYKMDETAIYFINGENG
jgi:hypothetical protein